MGTGGPAVMRGRRAPIAVVVALALLPALAGCEAYHSRYWSFPLNSTQVIENAAENNWSFRKAVLAELLFNVFPYYWVISLPDLLLLPVTLVHDLVVAVADEPGGKSFDEQIRAEKQLHPTRRPPPTLDRDVPSHVPSPQPSSGFER